MPGDKTYRWHPPLKPQKKSQLHKKLKALTRKSREWWVCVCVCARTAYTVVHCIDLSLSGAQGQILMVPSTSGKPSKAKNGRHNYIDASFCFFAMINMILSSPTLASGDICMFPQLSLWNEMTFLKIIA